MKTIGDPIDLAIASGLALIAGWLVFWLRRWRTRRRLARVTAASARTATGTRVAGRGRLSALRRAARRVLVRRPVTAAGAVTALVAGLALLLAGGVAATVAALYSLMALIAVRRGLIRGEAERIVAELLESIDTTAEELRAGTVPDGAAARAGMTARRGNARRRVEAAVLVARARLDAAYRLSERLGVPLADLLDRVDADLRATQALRGGVAAQTSAAQATAAVLLALPLAGLWVGAALGTHPVRQLLHTPLGAACAVAAVALQCAGFLWTGRMVYAAVAEVR